MAGTCHAESGNQQQRAAPMRTRDATILLLSGSMVTVGTGASGRKYTKTRMYDARKAFAPGSSTQFLRGLQPQVLSLDGQPPVLINLSLPAIDGPASLGQPARNREMGLFNPSMVAAPAGLCPRCAFMTAIRVDALHQCHDMSPLLHVEEGMPRVVSVSSWFKGTAIAVLDSSLRVLGWTWLINAPQHQVSSTLQANKWAVPVGASDAYPPPWAKVVYDVRVVDFEGRYFVTYVCKKCTFSVASLQVTGTASADGGVHALRAWQSRRFTTGVSWAQGRNQALFVAPRRRGGPLELMVQPWMGVVGSFGAADFERKPVLCTTKRGRAAAGDAGAQPAGPRICGTTPFDSVIHIDNVKNDKFGRKLELLANHTSPALRREAIGGHRLSTTSNLLPVSRESSGSGSCMAYLGVGHAHRREGSLNLKMKGIRTRGKGRRRRHGRSADAVEVPLPTEPNSSVPLINTTNETFKWGYEYTHFFYAIEPHEPFRTLATSAEFCIGSLQDSGDCESVQ